MSKVIFLGDIHVSSRTPLSRLDDYSDTVLKKLEAVCNYASEQGISFVITTGDFFENYHEPTSYMNKIFETLKKFMDKNIEIFSTIGNHDLPYNNMNYFNTTPLSLLFKSGFVKKLDNLIINNTVIHGLHFSESLDKIELDSEMTNILTMHYALNDTVPYESIKAKDLLNFDMVIAGHDHMYYEPLTVEETTFLRPGSLTRQTKDQYNLERSIVFYVVDLESLEFSEVLVPNVMPAEKVFKNEVFSERSLNLYSNEFNSLFSGDTEEKDLYDIESILEDLPPTVLKKSKEEVIKFLKAKGLNN